VNILGLDTSTPACSVAVLRSDGATFEAEPSPEALAGAPAHARDLLAACASVLAAADLGWQDVAVVAVGVGPGAFTGLRIGVASARALALANGAELRPVSSLAALAHGIPDPLALPLIDARRGEVFGALFAGSKERWPAFAAAPGDVATRVAESGFNPLAAGNGSVAFRAQLEAAGVRVAAPGSSAHVVSGLSVCRLAESAPPVPPEAVVPDYLRLPDAKPHK
jgi:tRNA threonylcarbamoyladenosine biosynthesis protein TsaB